MIAEAPLRIMLNGRVPLLLTCSPHEPEVLARGHVLTEWVHSVEQVLNVNTSGDVVHVTIPEDLLALVASERAHGLQHGCGVRHVLDCKGADALQVQRAPAPAQPALLLRALFAATDEAAPEGGMHGVAISDGTSLLHTGADVARHCALDRAVGAAAGDCAQGAPLAGLGVVATARISGAMALKCAHAGAAWIVTRGLATSLAHEIAQHAGMRIIERAGRGGAS